MVQTALHSMSFDEFLDWHPSNGRRFELLNGVAIEVNPTGEHEEISGFLSGILFLEIQRSQLPYLIPKSATIQPPRDGYGYKPDVILLEKEAQESEPDWKKKSTLRSGTSIKLVIEIVSTNWRDDYLTKLADYEALGICEYWICDYAGLGGRRFIGNHKQPTFSVNVLVDGEYQTQLFRGEDRIISPTFEQLNLTAEQVFRAAVL